jgi:hypothetical protein
VSADGRDLVSQAGAVLLWETLRVTGLGRGLSAGLARWRALRAVHDPGKPHRALPHRTTPATIYAARPKATPTAGRDTDTHDRIRRDRVDATGVVTLRHAGRLHHIGIGRTHARAHVLLLVQDLDISVIDAATGELLRELTLEPSRDYQPTGAPKGPTPGHTNEQPRTPVVGSGSFLCLERSQSGGRGIRTHEDAHAP